MHFNFDNSYAKLPEVFYARMEPRKVSHPSLVIFNSDLAKALGLSKLDANELGNMFSGNQLPEGADAIALAYAGHQFGYFNILGDGRAHLLGEHVTPNGTRVDVQLKGSGKTPFGRRGDGRATLGPMLREYLISEAMHGLRIPTTRSLAVVTSGEMVQRESLLPGAILTRIAASHIRIGSFEYFYAKEDHTHLKQLIDYTISRHYPQLQQQKQPYLALLKEVMLRQTDLVIDWLRVGFIHGVMNTDNMTLSGETIDYGPCAFMDTYHPETVFSSIDNEGRYAFANQPVIVHWNLTRLAETLIPFIHPKTEQAIELAKGVLNEYSDLFKTKWLNMMRGKLGLVDEHPDDEGLIHEFLTMMQHQKLDYTNSFIALNDGESFKDQSWFKHWQERRESDIKASTHLMQTHNPLVIPRNHQVESALKLAVAGDMAAFKKLLKVVSQPYKRQSGLADYQNPPKPEEAVLQTFCGT